MLAKLSVIAGIVASIAIVPTVHGQDAVHLGIGGGVAIPAGTFRDSYNARENVLITAAVGPQTSPVGFRLDYSYTEFGSRHVSGGPSQGMHLNIATANLIVSAPAGIIKPYLVGGGGLYNFREATESKAGNDFGLNAGVGCTFPLWTKTGFIEARYHRIFGRTVSEQVIPVTLGILF